MVILGVFLESTCTGSGISYRLAVEPETEFTDFIRGNVIRGLDFGIIEEFSDEKVIISDGFDRPTLFDLHIFKKLLFKIPNIMRHASSIPLVTNLRPSCALPLFML
jgi:hypothetical protein